MKRLISAFILLALCSSALNAQTAHAGATIHVGSGFNAPYGVAVDGYGNVFVADTGHSQVKEIVAVNGAVSASSTVNAIGSDFNQPSGVAVDGYGNVFVADSTNSQVKEIVAVNGAVSASSTVNVIGSDFSYPAGVAVDGYGNVFVADQGHSQVKEIVAVNGAVSASSSVNVIGSDFSHPAGVAVDGYGNVFVADYGNHQVKEIVAVNGAVSASSTVNVIGSGFTQPEGVAVDGYGNVFVADAGGLNSALEILAVNGAVSATSTVERVGTGYSHPIGVAVDSSGNVFVANSGGNDALETLSGTQKFPTTAVGSTSAPLTVYFTFDTAGSLAATPYVVLTQGAKNLDFQAAATQPSNACVTGHSYNAGDICAVNVTFAPTNPGQRIGAVQLMGASGSPIATFNLDGIGTGPQVVFNAPLTPTVLGGGFSQPWGVAVDGNGNIYVADEDSGEVKEMPPGCLSASCVTILGGGFPSPEGVAVDGGGSVYVADPSSGVVSKIPAGCTSASCVTTLGGGFQFPHGLALDASGNVYVPDQGKHAVYEIPAGCTSASCVITLGGGFSFPYGVALDASENVYVADASNSAVLVIPAGCKSQTCVTTLGGGFSGPTGVAVDASGNVYVADTDNNAVKEVPAGCTSSNCVITLQSGFNTPQGVAVDGSGNIYVGDRHNNAVKELVRSTPPSLTFASTSVYSTSSDSPHLATVQNSGNATLSGTLSVGTNFTQVAGSGNPADCSAAFSLTPGQECNLSISFTPITVGPLTGSATFTDNALNATPSASQAIQLAGTGLQATQSITFNNPGVQVVGVPLTLTATATSGLAVSYLSTTQTVCTVSSATVTFLAPGNCSLTASQLGNANYSAAMSVTQTFYVSATPIAPFAPNNGVFLNTNVGATSAPTTVSFTFDESETLASTPYVVLTQGALNLDFKAAKFQLSTVCTGGQTYNPGDSCTVNVTFTPTKPYQRIGAVQLMGSGGTPIATFNVHGTGTGPQVIFPSNSAVTTLPSGSGFNVPSGVAVDGSGNVFVADTNNNAVKEIVAVNGVVSASSSVITVGSNFSYPYGVAVDGSGNVFVADTDNNAVKEIVAVNGVVSASSSVITVGSSFNEPNGVAVDASGNVFVADTRNDAVKEIVAANGVVSSNSSVIPVGSSFYIPFGVAVDSSGNVFVADTGNNAVKEIVAVNGVVSSSSSVIPLGTGSYHQPPGVALDGSGNVFVVNSANGAVQEIVAVNGVVSSSSSVITLSRRFGDSSGIAVDASGNVFIADTNNSVIKEIDRADAPSLTFASTAVGVASSDSPQSVLFQNNGNATLTAVSPGLIVTTNFAQVPGSGTPADCSAAFSLTPGQECNLSISFIPQSANTLTGTATFTDNALNASPSASQAIQLAGTGLQATQSITFNNPGVQVVGVPLTLTATATSGLAVSYQSTTQTVCTVSSATVTFLAPGNCSLTASQLGNANYSAAMSVTQTFYVSATPIAPSAPNNGVFPGTNVGTTSAATTVSFTFDESETLASTPYVVLTQGALNLDFKAASTQLSTVCTGGQTYNSGDSCTVNVTFTPTKPYQRIGAVQLMGSGGMPIATANLQGTGVGPQLIFPSNSTLSTLNSTFNNPEGVAVDGSGNVFVSDQGNHAIVKIMAGTSQAITLVSGLYGVRSLAVDGSGNLFFADEGTAAVQEIVAVNGALSANSQVITVASGFNSPRGVAVDGGGNVFVADFNSAVYEVVATNGVVSNSSTVIQLATNFNFNRAQSVAVDAGGNVFVADTYSNAVVEIVAVNGAVSATSQVITLASNFSFSYPSGVAVDGSGNVYVADTSHNAVVEIVAVNGAVSSSSTAVSLGNGYNSPFALAVDASGNLFVVNQNSNSLTELDRSDPPSLTFANTNVNSTSSDSPQSVTVQNAGNANLTGTLNVGTNFTQVAGSGTPADCTASLSLTPSQECNLSISFKPTISGPLSAFATLTSNTPASPQSIPLSGTGVALTQTIQNFGTIPTQTVGTPLLLTATATSGLAVSYQSTTLTVCTVNGSTVSFLTPGQCSLTASQTGNSSYSAAQPITQQFTVNPNTPTISNLQAVSVGGNSELITWTTDQPSTTTISGTVTTTPDSNLVTFHSVTLSGLSQNTTYNYSVSSTNSTNGTATSPSANFTTTPYVGYVAFWGVNNSGITISWSTDFAATTFVAYGTTSALGQTSPIQTALSNSHGAVLTGLNPGTTYYFRAESTDANNHTGASTLYTFTTTGQPASPAPVITNVTVTNITTTGATITWTTDQAATTQVNYGTTTAYGSSSSLNSSLVTSHSVVLTNLTPGTTYNYDVISTNSSGTSSGMSTNYTFATTAVIATPPAISNIQAAVTSTTATITWTTDQPANSAISGTVTTTPDSNYVTSHSVTLTGLTPGTLYNFSVISTNAAALTTTSPASTFTTTAANATAPYVGYVAFWGVNNSGVTISWSTDVPANTQLNYGTSPSLGTLTPVQATLTNSHGVVLTNLASGTTYYFVAQSTGANGATGYSTTYSFTTTGSPSAPAPNISNIQTSVTATTATITWTTDEAASSQVNYGVTTTYAASSTLNSTLTTSHSITLTNLMPGTTYNFDVVSSNVNNLSSTSNNSTFQTTGSAPGPIISSVAASSITSSTALITWTTDQAATSVVNYGNQTVSSPTLVTSHSVTLSGLTPNTQYSFTVTSVNASSVSTTSNSTIFTTSAQSAAPPVISYVAFWGVTSSGVTISWSTNVPSNTAVNYGQTGSLGTVTPVQTALANTHGVTLTNLQPSTTYYFEAQSADVNGNTGTSTIYSFTTLAGGLPVISNLLVTPNANNTANISWTTSVPTNSYVQYGPSSGNYNRYSAQTNLTSSPNCTLSYVPSGTVYYQLVSTDAQGNQVVSPEAKFVEP